MIKKLTDEECLELRQIKGSLNDMVRAVYEAGAEQQKKEIVDFLEFEALSWDEYSTTEECKNEGFEIHSQCRADELRDCVGEIINDNK